jgi:hypothetical protein
MLVRIVCDCCGREITGRSDSTAAKGEEEVVLSGLCDECDRFLSQQPQ